MDPPRNLPETRCLDDESQYGQLRSRRLESRKARKSAEQWMDHDPHVAERYQYQVRHLAAIAGLAYRYGMFWQCWIDGDGI